MMGVEWDEGLVFIQRCSTRMVFCGDGIVLDLSCRGGYTNPYVELTGLELHTHKHVNECKFFKW